MRKHRRYEPAARHIDCDAGGVTSDPPPSESFCAISGRTRATSRIENEIAGLRRHGDASGHNLGIRPDNVVLASREPCHARIQPEVGQRICAEVIQVTDVAEGIPNDDEPFRSPQTLHSLLVGLPSGRTGRPVFLSFDSDGPLLVRSARAAAAQVAWSKQAVAFRKGRLAFALF